MNTFGPESGDPGAEMTGRDRVPNRYKDALRTADGNLRAIEQAVSGAFDTAIRTLSDNAWEGPRAESWFHELRRQRAVSSAYLDACCHECAQALRGQPEDVEPDDRRAGWSPSAGS